MLGFLRGLFGKARADAKGEISFAPGPMPVARPSNEQEDGAFPADAGTPRDSAFFCREALVGRDQKIVGYEFGYPQHLQPRIMEKRASLRQYYDDLLLRHLAELKLDSFLGDRLALIEISHASLEHPALAALPRKNVALMLSFSEAETPNAQFLAETMVSASQLRANGVSIGLKCPSGWQDESEETDLPPLPLAYADFIQVAWGNDAARDHSAFLSRLRQAAASSAEGRQAGPPRLIASGLQTPNDFWQCYRLGVDFFRGPFIGSRDRSKETKSAINRLRVLQLLRKLRHDADTTQLEEDLRQDPVLSYRLLTYANSPLMGTMNKITHLGQAVVLVGRNNLYRWLASLLFNVADPGYYDWALTEQALARARLMENLGRSAGLDTEALFLTGLFSLLDQLMGEPMEDLARQVQISENIRNALVRRQGILAQFLALAESCERMDPETIARNAEALGLTSRAVGAAVFDALAWAHTMSGANAG